MKNVQKSSKKGEKSCFLTLKGEKVIETGLCQVVHIQTTLTNKRPLKSKIVYKHLSKERPGGNQRQKNSIIFFNFFRKKQNSLKIKNTIYQIRTLNMFLCYSYLHVYTQIEPTKCIYLMSFFQFLISLCSYVSLFLSSTYLSLPETLHIKYEH